MDIYSATRRLNRPFSFDGASMKGDDLPLGAHGLIHEPSLSSHRPRRGADTLVGLVDGSLTQVVAAVSIGSASR